METFILEIQETIDSATRAQSALDAGMWSSLADLVTNSFLFSYNKHRKLSMADEALENAQKAVNSLNRRLNRLAELGRVNMEKHNLTSVGDLWLDFELLDAMTHIKIGNAQRNVTNAIKQVERIRKNLKAKLAEMKR